MRQNDHLGTVGFALAAVAALPLPAFLNAAFASALILVATAVAVASLWLWLGPPPALARHTRRLPPLTFLLVLLIAATVGTLSHFAGQAGIEARARAAREEATAAAAAHAHQRAVAEAAQRVAEAAAAAARAEAERPPHERGVAAVVAVLTADGAGRAGALARARTLLDPLPEAARATPAVACALRLLRQHERALDRQSDEDGARSAGAHLLCNDGTRSPTCRCDRASRRGCCSYHHGVSGCEDVPAAPFRPGAPPACAPPLVAGASLAAVAAAAARPVP